MSMSCPASLATQVTRCFLLGMVMVAFAPLQLGCSTTTTDTRKGKAKVEQKLEQERSKLVAFIERGKAKNDKAYRTQYKTYLETYQKQVGEQNGLTTPLYLYGFLLNRLNKKWRQFNECLKIDPKHFWCRIGRGKIYLRWKVKDRAEADFMAAKKLRPNHVQPLLGLAELAMLRNNSKNAIRYYKSILAKDEKSVDALFGLALLNKEKGNIDQAISFYKRVLQANATHFDSLRALGDIYFKRKQMSQAADAYDRAFKVRPKTFRLLVRLATIYETSLSQPDRALSLFERASRMPQSHFLTYFRLGVLRGNKGRVDKGIAALNQAIRLQPEHPGALLALGRLYILKQNAEKAVPTLWKALRLNNGNIASRVELAKALKLKGDYAGVLNQYEEILKLDKDKADIKQSMSSLLGKLGLDNKTFTGNSARQVYNKGRRRVNSCYKNRLKAKPKLKGNIAIKLLITPTGTVDRVSILYDKTTLKDKLVHACVKWTYRRANFPRLSRPRAYQIKSTLTFAP